MSEPKGLYYNVNKRKKAGTSRSKNNPKAPSDADWKNAAKTAKVSEAIVDHAGTADSDHEVQMARADLYNIADKALKLHKILKNISEQEGIQGWQQAKITKAADYMDAVFSSLNYETMSTMSTVQTRPASNGSVGVSTTMSESEIADYKALLEKATTRAKTRVMAMSESEANEAKWYSGPKPPPRKKPKPAAAGAPQKKNRLRNMAGAAALAAAGLGAGAGSVSNDYVQNFGNTTAQPTQSQKAAAQGGGSSSSDLQAALAKQFADYEKSKDAAVDDVAATTARDAKIAGDVTTAIGTGAKNTINAMNGGTSGDSGSVNPASSTTANATQTVDPTFMPSVDRTFVTAKAKWLATNPYPEQIREFNKLITFYNNAAKVGGQAVRNRGVKATDQWLADPSNAGRGSVDAASAPTAKDRGNNESKNYRIAENKRNNNDYF